jgi:hypothetical protein
MNPVESAHRIHGYGARLPVAVRPEGLSSGTALLPLPENIRFRTLPGSRHRRPGVSSHAPYLPGCRGFPAGFRCSPASCKCSPAGCKCSIASCKCSSASCKCSIANCKCSTAGCKCSIASCKCSPASCKCSTISCKCSPASCGASRESSRDACRSFAVRDARRRISPCFRPGCPDGGRSGFRHQPSRHKTAPRKV